MSTAEIKEIKIVLRYLLAMPSHSYLTLIPRHILCLLADRHFKEFKHV